MVDKATVIYDSLRNVQLELKAPKSQFNSFGKYHYRNVEDILEAVKPVLQKHELTLVVSDELVNIGDRYYVKATAAVSGLDCTVTATGYAREEETKKGMDGAQITGAASSYARKYALNGLFAIDDTKDADSQDNRAQTSSAAKPSIGSQPAKALEAPDSPATPVKKKRVADLLRKRGVDNDAMATVLELDYGIQPGKMTNAQADNIITLESDIA